MPVTIYEHANYQGRSQVLAKGNTTPPSVKSPSATTE